MDSLPEDLIKVLLRTLPLSATDKYCVTNSSIYDACDENIWKEKAEKIYPHPIPSPHGWRWTAHNKMVNVFVAIDDLPTGHLTKETHRLLLNIYEPISYIPTLLLMANIITEQDDSSSIHLTINGKTYAYDDDDPDLEIINLNLIDEFNSSNVLETYTFAATEEIGQCFINDINVFGALEEIHVARFEF